MKKYIYYHLYLPDEAAAWSNYLLEQFKLAEDHGLIDAVERFHLQVIGKPKNIDLAKGLCASLSNKIVVTAFEDKFKTDSDLHSLDRDLHGHGVRPITEHATMELIYEHALKEDAHFLYAHAKGVTSYERCLRAGRFNEFRNYFYWRKFLEWGTVEKWKECNEKLETYDLVGCNYAEWPMKHFSGNYWWSKSEYIRKLADIRDVNWWTRELNTHPIMRTLTWRLRDEMWIGSHPECKMYSFKDTDNPPPHGTLAVELMIRKKYA